MGLVSSIKIGLSGFIQYLKRPGQYRKLRAFIRKEKSLVAEIFQAVPQAKKGTLIIKCDDIGDFLMWQQIIPLIKTQAERPVYFVCNSVNKPLVENYFDFADEYVWIDKSRWTDPAYRFEQYKLVNSFNARIAFTTLFTRNFRMDDMLLMASAAEERIAWDISHHAYYPGMAAELADVTTRTVLSPARTELEYFRNIEFINQIYGISSPKEFKPLFPNFGKQNRLVVVSKASAPSKCWKPEYLSEVIREVMPHFDSVLLIGGKDSMEVSGQIERSVDNPKLINLAGQTSIHELVVFIGESRLLLCPDTFALHSGVISATDIVLLTNGTNWQRFMNYAPYIPSRIKVVYPPGFVEDFSKVKLSYSRSEINQIKPSTVIKAIKSML